MWRRRWFLMMCQCSCPLVIFLSIFLNRHSFIRVKKARSKIYTCAANFITSGLVYSHPNTCQYPCPLVTLQPTNPPTIQAVKTIDNRIIVPFLSLFTLKIFVNLFLIIFSPPSKIMAYNALGTVAIAYCRSA